MPNRRRFLSVASASMLLGIAGCSEITGSEPDPTLGEYLSTESRPVNRNQDGNHFQFTIENSGFRGEIAVALFWMMEREAEKPEFAHKTEALFLENIEFKARNNFYFDQNERRTVEFIGRPPRGAVGYYFVGTPLSNGAEIINGGGAGEVMVSIEYSSPDHAGSPLSKEKRVFLDQNQTKPVLFNVMVDSGEYSITASKK